MKKNILKIATTLFVASVLVVGCKKDDVDAPVITLNGDASQTISLNSSYTDPGATATDEEDGDVTVTTTGSVDKDKTGTYTLTYTATDVAGNEATATRTVIVKNDAESMGGTYSVAENCNGSNFNYSGIVVTPSETVNNRLIFTKFGNYLGANSIYVNVTGTNIDLPSQSTGGNVGTGSGCDVATHKFTGTGTKASSGNGFTLNITDEIISPSSCISSTPCTQVYTK